VTQNHRYWNEMSPQVVGRECISHLKIYFGFTSSLQFRLRQERSQHEHSDVVQVL